MSRFDMLGRLVEKLVEISDEALGMIFDLLEKTLDPAWFSEFKKFLRKEPCWVIAEVGVEKVAKAIRCLTHTLFSGVRLGPTTGQEVLAASEVFTGYCDPAFTEGGADQPTGEANADVEEMIEDAKYRKLFNSFGRDPDYLDWTRSQITMFCRDHRDKLRGDGFGTFFLFKKGKKFFVAHVLVGDGYGRLYVNVYSLADDHVWYAGYRPRIAVPQQTLSFVA